TLAGGMKRYPQLLRNVRVDDKNAVMENEAVRAMEKEISEELGANGRILLRESGTEPLIRVMVEAETDQLCEQYVSRMVDIINKERN
ncbi:MAG: phosphoglucosamine mutase, partial [Lachnospiraceae bacterium]|nr:phosphoglucosamine mutase [Lachnospiraceae bacterium]